MDKSRGFYIDIGCYFKSKIPSEISGLLQTSNKGWSGIADILILHQTSIELVNIACIK